MVAAVFAAAGSGETFIVFGLLVFVNPQEAVTAAVLPAITLGGEEREATPQGRLEGVLVWGSAEERELSVHDKVF